MSAPFFNITLLPAAHGDGIWIEYGSGARTRRIVIDGGPINAYQDFEASFARLPDGDKRVELFVVTHVDTDHIEAPVRLLAQRRQRWPFAPNDIWFNGYRHMTAQPHLGARDGEFLSALLNQNAPAEWNKAFAGKAVALPKDGVPPSIALADGMVLRLLAPDTAQLAKMAKTWEKQLKAMTPGDLKRALEELAKDRRYRAATRILGPEDLSAKLREQLDGVDPSVANGTSIAFLAQFKNKSCLLLADAPMKTVCRSIRALLPRGQSRLIVDAVKISHHGSENNITAEFFELVDAEHFLVSTNGDHHDHPDKAAMQAIITGASRKPTIWFNYRSGSPGRWEAGSKKAGAKYATCYPRKGAAGITLPLF